MIHKSAIAFTAILIGLFALTGLVGCNTDQSPATSPRTTVENITPAPLTPDSIQMGAFQFVFGDDGTVKVEKDPSARNAQFDVSAFAWVVIDYFYFNETERNWYITATIKNISKYDGYDVWAVFHSLGGKYLVNQDGFIWGLPPIFPEPTRCAYIAYGKNQPNRIFPSMFSDQRIIVIHQPTGTPKLAPIGFWIDATGQPRQNPFVEDLKVTPIDPTNYQLTGYVWDHQSPSTDLTVWADCTNFNGNDNVPMFDDGLHDDEAAGDNIFGCTFSGNPATGNYTITVYAIDPFNNTAENDVTFHHGQENPPCTDVPWEVLATGEHSCATIGTYGFNDPSGYQAFWNYVHCGYDVPELPIDPEPVNDGTIYHFGIQMFETNTTGFFLTVEKVCYQDCTVNVTYVKHYPSADCPVFEVKTQPWLVGAVELPDNGCTWTWNFVGNYQEEGCDQKDCYGFSQIAGGSNTECHDAFKKLITTEEEYNTYWEDCHPGVDKPQVAFQYGYAVWAIHLGERPTTGYEVNIYEICDSTDPEGITIGWVEWIPGIFCPTENTPTYPWRVVLFKLQDKQYYDKGVEEIWWCPK